MMKGVAIGVNLAPERRSYSDRHLLEGYPPPHPPPRARAHVALAGAAAAGGLGLGTVGAGRSVRSEPALMEEVVLLPLSRPSFSSPPLSSAVRAN